MASVVEPLDAACILASLGGEVRKRVSRLDVAESLDSTNKMLMERLAPAVGFSEVQLADFQTAGRGRRGRSWVAPRGGAICLSLSWAFAQQPRDVGALSLAIGVCVLRALLPHGAQGLQLKWPNDILAGGRKLGGILIELRAEPAGAATVVIGIGLNVALGEGALAEIAALGRPATDLTSAGLRAPSRNAIAAGLIECCLQGVREFERGGLQPFADEWRHADALHSTPVEIQAVDSNIRGVARGIDLSGALLVETPQGLQKIYSGDVTARAIT